MNSSRSRTARTTGALAGMAVCAVVLASCGAGEALTERVVEEAAERAAGGEVDINTDDGSVTVETDEGSVSIGGGELPEGLPDEFPVPDGLEVFGSISQEGQDGRTVGFQATSQDSFEDLVAYFDDELAAGGWTITDNITSDVGGAVRNESWEIEGYGLTGNVALTLIGEEGGEQQLSLLVSLESAPQE